MSSQRGYTLLELIVSLGIFSLVMLVVIGAYVTLIGLDRQARANNQLAASLSFAIESMARNMRTGQEYSTTGDRISFTDSEGNDMTYLRSGNSLAQCTGSPCSASNAIALTDPNIVISSVEFYVRGVGLGDNRQPSVVFTVAGSMETSPGESTTFSIQTASTQRYIEL